MCLSANRIRTVSFGCILITSTRLEGAGLIYFEDEDTPYLVTDRVYPSVEHEVKLVILSLAVTRQGNPFIWPVPCPPSDGRTNSWNESALRAALAAQESWVRVKSNKATKTYDVITAGAALGEPRFPDLSFSALLGIAFRDHIVDAPDHPALRRLRGEV